jgi:cation:H+ antiporter
MTGWLDFASYPVWLNLAVFVFAAGIVYFAGVRITRAADAISSSTGVSQATVGLLLLAFVTSLPEVAVSLTAAYTGNAALAVNSLLGGVAMQAAILAVADAAIGRGALTAIVADPIILLQAVLNIILLALVAMATVTGDVSILGVGAWAWGICALYLLAATQIARWQGHLPWRVARHGPKTGSQQDNESDSGERPPLRREVIATIAAAAAILVAGFALAKTGEAVAQQTGLGSSFVGAVLVALSTSLPEFSTVLTAVWLGRYLMAVSDIFGTNLFHYALIFPVDAVQTGAPVLDQVGRFSTFAALLAILIIALFTGGLIERRDRTVLHMGVDSVAVLVVYVIGLVILYRLR